MSSPNPLQQLSEAAFFELVAQEVNKLSKVYAHYSKIFDRFELTYKDEIKVYLKKYELPLTLGTRAWWNAKAAAKEILRVARKKRKVSNE